MTKYFYSILLFFFILSNSLLFSTENGEFVYKTEVKYTIPNLSDIPLTILEALKKGNEHKDLVKRGLVIQQYLAVTRKNILDLCQSLQSANIPFDSQHQLDNLTSPGKIQEIRFTQKCFKENEVVKELYQIIFQGSGELSNAKIQTPEILNEIQMLKLKGLFNDFYPRVKDVIYKLYFEILAKDVKNRSVLATGGSVRTVEIDIFLKNIEGKLSPFFINGEIKFREEDREQAIELASLFRKQSSLHPSYFKTDITDRKSLKTRNIALTGIPSDLASFFSEHIKENTSLVSSILGEFETWASSDCICSISASSPIQNSNFQQRFLLNAEPFGFGPSAAIAEIFPYLRKQIGHLSYIGYGHTLDLQRALPYDNIYDYKDTDITARKEKFLSIAKDYDVFITASDFEAANWAKELGLTLIIYDPLTWYWKDLPEIISRADLYIAQNFFGVKERLQGPIFPEYVIIPAIVSGLYDAKVDEDLKTLLVNMGGLSNPYLDPIDLETFAKIIFSSVRDNLEPMFDKTFYVTSHSIAKAAKEVCSAVVLQPHEVQQHLFTSHLAIMTSGLGNIYEASSMKKKVLWLPPANDSQGQQVQLLRKNGMIDFWIDWSDLFEEDKPIDYFAPQKEVLEQIALYMRKLSVDNNAQMRLKTLLQKTLKDSQKESLPALALLADTFEIHGAKQAAESILQWITDHDSLALFSRK